MIKRIKSLISVKNLSSSQFADLLGVQRSNISHILSGRNKPSLDFILKIIEHFPSVSIEWLLKGKGEMFNLEDKIPEPFPSQPDIRPENSILNPKIDEVLSENVAPDKEKGSETAEELARAVSGAGKEDIPQVELSTVVDKEDGIEQIMVLYKNGSFRVFTPEK